MPTGRTVLKQFWLLGLPITLLMGTAFFLPHWAKGQAFVNGSIAGTVTDNTGAVVPDVAITLTNLATSVKLSTQTNASGFYHFLDLPPGNYRVEAERSGFEHVTRQPVVVQV